MGELIIWEKNSQLKFSGVFLAWIQHTTTNQINSLPDGLEPQALSCIVKLEYKKTHEMYTMFYDMVNVIGELDNGILISFFCLKFLSYQNIWSPEFADVFVQLEK